MGKITTKNKSVESVAGVPTPTYSLNTKKKMNPARASRSKARLEKFTSRKISEKMAAGDTTTSSTNRIILELSKPKDTPVETRLASKIVQLDGAEEVNSQKTDDTIQFHSFRSNWPSVTPSEKSFQYVELPALHSYRCRRQIGEF